MYKLEYFNIRGVAEQIRILFAVAKVEFEDVRYSVHFGSNGPVFDPVFEEAKLAGAYDVSMSKVPLLTYTDEEGVFILGQSKAIERFVAKKLDLLGSNDIDAVLIDMITEHVRDIKQKFMDVRLGKTGEDLADAKEKFLKEDLPIWFGKLEKCLSGWCASLYLSSLFLIVWRTYYQFCHC
jgi:glutathione S-transferase